ncbi:MAG: AAA family ATPase [Minisyncoccales bacterium]
MILGHGDQLGILEKILNQKKDHFAFLFSGPEGIGKKTVALFLIERIVKKNPFFHPDFFFLKEDEKKIISIKKIKELISFLSLKPFSAPFKSVIIDNAHLITPPGQQSFLKTLEEPKGKTLIILISHLPDFLLPTLRSRLQKIVFFQPKKEEVENYFKKIKIEKNFLQEILEFSFLKPRLLFQFLKEKEKIKEMKEEINLALKILKMPIFERFAFAKEISKKKDLRQILVFLVYYFRKIALNEIEKNFISERLIKIKEILSQLDDLIFLISYGKINTQLALENFFLKI